MINMKEPSIERPLGPTEDMYWRFDALSPINFGSMARISGPLNINNLRQALDAIQHRHPLLRVKVECDHKGVPWFRSGVAPIPLTVIDATPAEIWPSLESGINTPINTASGPMMRCLLLHHREEDSTLLMIYHHAISDGRSAVFLMRDILQSLAQQARGEPACLPALLPVGYYGDRIPKLEKYAGLDGLRTAWKTVKAITHFLESAGVPTGLQQENVEDVPLTEQRLIIEPRVIEPELLQRIARKTKAEHTTLQCVLNAALSLTVAEESPTHLLERTGCTQVLDMRDRLEPPVGEDCGCFVSGATSLHYLNATTEFWPFTRKIYEHLQHSIVTPLPFFYPVMHSSFMSLGRGLGIADTKKFSELISRLHPEGLAVSNLGRVTLEVDGSPVKVVEFGFATNTTVLNYLNTSAATLNGRMLWTFNGSSILTRERIAKIADCSIARIIKALDE